MGSPKKVKYAKPTSIRRARKRAGLTQWEAAYLISYSRRSWQEWEGGRRNMREDLLHQFKILVAG